MPHRLALTPEEVSSLRRRRAIILPRSAAATGPSNHYENYETIVPHAAGAVTPGPSALGVARLSPANLAAHFHVSRAMVYRWRNEGTIPPELVMFAGKRKLLFGAQVIGHLESRRRQGV